MVWFTPGKQCSRGAKAVLSSMIVVQLSRLGTAIMFKLQKQFCIEKKKTHRLQSQHQSAVLSSGTSW